jgi:hypothetical protein
MAVGTAMLIALSGNATLAFCENCGGKDLLVRPGFAGKRRARRTATGLAEATRAGEPLLTICVEVDFCTQFLC